MSCGRVEHIFKLTPRVRFEVCTSLLPEPDNDVIPPNAILDEDGNPILDGDGNYILEG